MALTIPEIENSIVIEPCKIIFNDYELLLNESKKLANFLHASVILPEQLSVSKKLVAELRKRIEDLDRIRINVKKQAMEPCAAFEKLIKNIITIVSDADKEYRDKIRMIEDREDEKKLEKITELFNKRVAEFELINKFNNEFTLQDFLKPTYLNKTFSIEKVEDELVTWLTTLNNDLKVIESFEPKEKADTALNLYKEYRNLSKVILKLNKSENGGCKCDDHVYGIEVYSNDDARKVEEFMRENDIRYTIFKLY
jgi:hypothetical protein